MLKQRLAVAAVGIPLLAGLLALPEPFFAAVVALLLAVATFEMIRALVPDLALSLPLSAGVTTALFVAIARQEPGLPWWGLLAVMAIALAMILRPTSRLSNSIGGWWITAVLYVAVLGAHLVMLRLEPHGQAWLVLLLVSTFTTDTGAYAAGRLLGRHRLAPAISPNKTWEGAAGGLLFGAAGGLAVLFGPTDLSLEPVGVALVALLLPVLAMAGDLLESALKRRMDVKDMSALLPGHGGLLDRLDSVLLVGVGLYWIVRWFQT